MFKVFTYRNSVFLLVGVLSLLISCKSAEKVVTVEQEKALESVQALLESKAYQIKVNTVFPFNTAASMAVINSLLVPRTGNNANRIEVRGDGHFIKFENDIMTSDLPFFGEQRFGSGNYSGRYNGVNFDGVPEGYKVERNGKKNKIGVTFKTRQKGNNTESYNVTLTVFDSKTVDVTVFSSHRTVIRYSGILDVLEPIE